MQINMPALDGRTYLEVWSKMSRQSEWNKANPERAKATKQKWRKNNPESHRKSCAKQYRQFKYGISMDQFQAMIEAQNGLCAICKTKPDRTLVIDHDHKTDKVRGLLCNHCNSIIGFARDNPQVLVSAIQYLNLHVSPMCYNPSVVDGWVDIDTEVDFPE